MGRFPMAMYVIRIQQEDGLTDQVCHHLQQMQTLLAHLQDDQVNREQYYKGTRMRSLATQAISNGNRKDLNTWLQSNASQTGSQYHSLATELQKLTQALAPASIPPPSDQQDPSSSSAPDPGASANIFQDIRQALAENNNRNKTNDNFLAAANHLISAANAERQQLGKIFGK